MLKACDKNDLCGGEPRCVWVRAVMEKLMNNGFYSNGCICVRECAL